MMAGRIDERVVHYAGYDGFDDRRIGQARRALALWKAALR